MLKFIVMLSVSVLASLVGVGASIAATPIPPPNVNVSVDVKAGTTSPTNTAVDPSSSLTREDAETLKTQLDVLKDYKEKEELARKKAEAANPPVEEGDFFAADLKQKLEDDEARSKWFRVHGLWLSAGKDLGKRPYTAEWASHLVLGPAPAGKWMVVSDYNPKDPKSSKYKEQVFDQRIVRVLWYVNGSVREPVVIAKCGNPMGPVPLDGNKKVSAATDMVPAAASGKNDTEEDERPPIPHKRKKKAQKKCENEFITVDADSDDIEF